MPHDMEPEAPLPSPLGGATHSPVGTEDLLNLTERARARAEEDPFGNPVLAVALAINRLMDEGELPLAHIATLIAELRDEAFAGRSRRLASYVGGTNGAVAMAAFESLATRLVRPDPDDSPVPLKQFRASVERIRFAAVFTAHPTFAVPPPVFAALARSAGSGAAGGEVAGSGAAASSFSSHRPTRPTLSDEFEAAHTAIVHGRDALDCFTRALLEAARGCWPDRWTEVQPRAIVLASWVGYDTDGRTDIGWWDTLRLRLTMKRLQLERVLGQVSQVSGTDGLGARLSQAVGAVEAQIAACPKSADPEATAGFAAALIGERETALVSPDPLAPLFEAAMRQADEAGRMELAIARAGLAAHGMSLAHTHVRLNSSQIHNAVRLRLGMDAQSDDRARRRTQLAGINAALDQVAPIPVDFGAILAEQASATKLMMTVAQIVKHIDGAAPVRFLIAETESGYTLLCALYLAKLFGIEKRIEISPLFETADALEHGARVLEEALRSPHYREYLRATGRMALQFGYSDSGRYVGQLAASYLIERLRLKVADLMARHDLKDVEVVLFDTHGESIGRGAHPGSLMDRLRYLSPAVARQAFARAGVATREESAFQGGDGYLLFGTDALAMATISCIARHAFAPVPTTDDPIYTDPDFSADFFTTIGISMQGLVEDPGYAALLGAFGPALLDPSGSRPAARQSDSGGPAVIRHPRELRAIPNNAILQQLGWCANTLQGVGAAASRTPELFADMLEQSPRFRRAMDFAEHALHHSDLDVLRAVIAMIDPGSWLDRAAHARRPGRAQALAEVARSLEQLDLWAPAQAMFRRIQADHVRLREAWPSAPAMATPEMLLHALRIALIGRIWLLATGIPEFSPRHGTTREALAARILRLDVPAALVILGEVFPSQPDPSLHRDYAEPRGPLAAASYEREHTAIIAPIEQLFALVREIGTAVTHHVGAFG
jgi:phosphoenolpyruvate carboxylase